MAKSEHKLTNEAKHTASATDEHTIAGAGAVMKRASFDSGYHSIHGDSAGEGEGAGETGNNAETICYPPNGPGKSETPQSGAQLFDERFRQMLLEGEGVMGFHSSATDTSHSNINNASTYTGNSGKL